MLSALHGDRSLDFRVVAEFEYDLPDESTFTSECHDWNVLKLKDSYLWCCYAIAWGIKQFESAVFFPNCEG